MFAPRAMSVIESKLQQIRDQSTWSSRIKCACRIARHHTSNTLLVCATGIVWMEWHVIEFTQSEEDACFVNELTFPNLQNVCALVKQTRAKIEEVMHAQEIMLHQLSWPLV